MTTFAGVRVMKPAMRIATFVIALIAMLLAGATTSAIEPPRSS